jgi:O-antigen/teichoic acid export membrane protein
MKALTKRLSQFYGTRTEKSIILSRLTGVLGIDILVKASGFLLIPFYLQLMSQAEFGLYNYILSIIQTFSLILNLGLYIPLSKYYHSDAGKTARGRLLFTIFATLGISLLAILIPVYLFKLDYRIIEFLFKSNFGYEQYRLMIMVGLIVSTLSFTFNSYLFTSEKIKQIKAYNICRIVIINIASIFALYFIDFDNVGTRLIFTYVGELILLSVFAGALLKEIVPSFNVKLMNTSLKLGLPVMISSIFGIIVNFGDKFFLEKYGSLEDLSDYYLAISFASIIPLIFASFQNVWLPVFMKEKDVERNYHKTQKIIIRLTSLFVILAILIWVGFQGLLYTGIIPWKYKEVSGILPIILIAQIVASIVPLLSNYFVYFEKTRIVSITGFFISIVTLLLARGLIPDFNIYGAALTVLVSNTLYLIIYYYTVLKVKKKYLTSGNNKASDE